MLKIDKIEKTTTKKMLMTDVSIHVHSGEIFALVGEHDSGKSLLSKIVLALSKKNKGTIKVDFGQTLGAFIPNERLMPKDTVITVIKDYCKITNKVFNIKRIKNILNMLGIKHLLHTQIYKLASNEYDKLKIAMPLVIRSEILILDSLFSNLNEKESKDMGVILKTICEKLKTAILITARNMRQIEQFADTIGIIDDGMMVSIQSYNQMIAKEMDIAKISITVEQPNYAAKVIEQGTGLSTKLCGDSVIVATSPTNAQKLVDFLISKNIRPLAVNRVLRSLQEQYYQIIQNRKNFY